MLCHFLSVPLKYSVAYLYDYYWCLCHCAINIISIPCQWNERMCFFGSRLFSPHIPLIWFEEWHQIPIDRLISTALKSPVNHTNFLRMEVLGILRGRESERERKNMMWKNYHFSFDIQRKNFQVYMDFVRKNSAFIQVSCQFLIGFSWKKLN